MTTLTTREEMLLDMMQMLIRQLAVNCTAFEQIVAEADGSSEYAEKLARAVSLQRDFIASIRAVLARNLA